MSDINVQIYPNPTSGIVNLTSETQKIISLEIKSLTGKIVFSTIDYPKMEITANLNEQPNGIYFVHVKLEDDSIIVKRVVKQ